MLQTRRHLQVIYTRRKNGRSLGIFQKISAVSEIGELCIENLPSSSSLGATALREPWPPVLFASTGLYPELSFSILQFPSLVGPLERHLAI